MQLKSQIEQPRYPELEGETPDEEFRPPGVRIVEADRMGPSTGTSAVEERETLVVYDALESLLIVVM